MKYDKDTENDNVVDVRGRKSVAPAVAGGGAVLMIVGLLVSRLLGVDVTGLIGGGGGGAATQQQQGPGSAEPPKGPDPDAELVHFIKFVMKDVQDNFATMFKAQGRQYTYAKLYIFSDAIQTACGNASKDVGPFYCPGDWNAYIDLSFYRELKERFGSPGDFAQAYVLAHEIGHHLQNLTRKEGKEPRGLPGETKNQYSVRIELQADCYAGVWGKSAQGQNLLEVGDINEAITAATAIGDDRLQRQAGMEVNAEQFTHGTSAQRVKWFKRGFEAGDFSACDTFQTPSL
jgi:hypothetical protein